MPSSPTPRIRSGDSLCGVLGRHNDLALYERRVGLGDDVASQQRVQQFEALTAIQAVVDEALRFVAQHAGETSVRAAAVVIHIDVEALAEGLEDGAEVSLQAILHKARFWERYGQAGLNDRQIFVLNRLLDGFEGRLTTSKYATLAKTSPDTALRDISALMELGILVRGPEGGRSTGYEIADNAVD